MDGAATVDRLIQEWLEDEEEELASGTVQEDSKIVADESSQPTPEETRLSDLEPDSFLLPIPPPARQKHQQFYWYWDSESGTPALIPRRHGLEFTIRPSVDLLYAFSSKYQTTRGHKNRITISYVDGDVPAGAYLMDRSPPQVYHEGVISTQVIRVYYFKASAEARKYPRVEACIIRELDGRIVGSLEDQIFTYMHRVIPVVVASRNEIRRDAEEFGWNYAYLIYDKFENQFGGLYLSTYKKSDPKQRTGLIRCPLSVYAITGMLTILPGNSSSLLNFLRLDACLSMVDNASLLDYMAYRAQVATAKPVPRRFNHGMHFDTRCVLSRFNLPKTAHY